MRNSKENRNIDQNILSMRKLLQLTMKSFKFYTIDYEKCVKTIRILS